MNKRELIEHINNTLFDNLKDTLFTEPTLSITESAKDNKVTIAFETEQGGLLVGGMLKKFEKVTIPQFVADWIEVCKEHLTSSLYLAMTPSFLKTNNQGIELTIWIKKNEETFARAWLDGFEIEKEKRYLVKIVGMDNINGYLSYNKKLKKWFFGIASESRPYRLKHTRKELEEDGFGWVLDCPGAEVEEVEE
ncbi:DUF1642 domain-containing protein [Streptococcus sp. HMSC057G03]|uniref:DUF1642 domain-containing protein n=1 Tax=Streptococcus sp. HMSC057G03 TaxID=1715165 RepID=UPI0008BC24A3|nr:DUF1642 domain-containing protein [Streptococcus sp. HMSC057G03]OFN90512.1 hypothetical protein HMPREF2686_00790 [Streptococcus sp. HMSC057G03]